MFSLDLYCLLRDVLHGPHFYSVSFATRIIRICNAMKTFTHNRPNALRNGSIFSSLFEFVTHKKSEIYKQRSRICLSCLKKSLFLPLERPLLDCRKASSSMERGVSSKREGRVLEREGRVLEKRGALAVEMILTIPIFLN